MLIKLLLLWLQEDLCWVLYRIQTELEPAVFLVFYEVWRAIWNGIAQQNVLVVRYLIVLQIASVHLAHCIESDSAIRIDLKVCLQVLMLIWLGLYVSIRPHISCQGTLTLCLEKDHISFSHTDTKPYREVVLVRYDSLKLELIWLKVGSDEKLSPR